MKPHLFMFLLLVVLASICRAQSAEKITNANVVGMAKAGLPQSVIIKTIESSDAKFDVSANAMILLKKQGVANDVIAAMVEKTKGSALPVKSSNSVSKLPSLELINQLYSYQKSTGSVTPLEKTFAAMKAKTKFLGYGGASVVLTVEGDKSPVRVTDTATTFVIHALESIVQAECDEAHLKLTTTTDSLQKSAFGAHMLYLVQLQLKAIAKDESKKVLNEPYETLIGVAGLLTEKCTVWWGEKFKIGTLK